MKRWFWLAVLALLLGGLAVGWNLQSGEPQKPREVAEPITLSQTAAAGKVAYEANCAVCHGRAGAGTNQGPPLVHVIYNPGHHADAAFQMAVKSGVRQHHWRYGNMPPQPHVSEADLLGIIRYVREVQRANGIAGE